MERRESTHLVHVRSGELKVKDLSVRNDTFIGDGLGDNDESLAKNGKKGAAVS